MLNHRQPQTTRASALGLLLAACAIALACAPTASSPASAPASTGAAPPAPPPAGAAATPAAASWDATVAAAKREGGLVISATAGAIWREVLLTFMQEYPEIRVEITGQNSSDLFPRMRSERAAGQYLWDLRVAGFGPETYEAKDTGMSDPLRPVLMLPENLDDSKWLGGLDNLFVDNDKRYLIGYLANVQSNIGVNRELVPATELRSGRELLDPRWKGKIVVQEPRSGGAGNAMLAVLMKSYGEQFVRDLLTQQDVTLIADYRQLAEWVIRGRYPIGVGLSNERLIPFKEQGLGHHVAQLTDPLNVSAGNGGIQLINRAPHPNAATVFVNWLLSRDVQARVSTAVSYNSRRTDVPAVDPAMAANPARLQDYVHDQQEDIMPIKERALALAKELLP
jgi:ABC-type Fe3+ transport system substrate-binding protein